MLNWDQVLMYVKGRLSLPSSFIEKSDNEIKEWVILTALKEFSDYVPDYEVTGVDPNVAKYQHDKQNMYYFFDDEDLEIIGVKNYYFSSGGDIATGHPYMSPFSYTNLRSFALAAFKSNMLKPYSYWGFTVKYYRPNILRVLPAIHDPFAIEYEREQPHDLRRVPGQHRRAFMDLALAETMLWLGGMRSHYGDGRISTPFGEIPLSGQELKSEGQELKRETIERLRETSIPSIIVDID